MPDDSFVQEIVEQSKPVFRKIGDLEYSSKNMSVIKKPTASQLEVSTLSAVIDYCKRELVADSCYIVHIKSFNVVNIYSQLSANTRQREIFIHAKCIMVQFPFGEYTPVEEFVVALQAQFVQDDTTEKILALVGNITSEAKSTVEDDGVTQRVTAKVGIVKTEDREVPNPVVLRPYRTFPEIEQPESKFVLRIKVEGPYCALYEADGGAWKNTAIASMSAFLNDGLKELVEAKRITILA